MAESETFPLARRLAEMAAQEETAALVQFAFLRPYLAELFQACAEAGLDVIALKGAALAETAYPRPSLRLFGDLDILIRPEQAEQVRGLLEALGYVADERQWNALRQGRGCQANFFQHPARGPVVVELHTKLINNPLFLAFVQMDMAGAWERSRPARLAGVDAHVLGPEDQILHLCLHLACHYLAAPRSLRDIDQVCRAGGVDWPLLTALAQSAHAASACFASLFAAESLLGTPIPSEVLDALAPRRGRRRLERLAAARAGDVEEAATEPLRFPLLWLLLPSRRARWNALRRTLIPTQDWLVTHYQPTPVDKGGKTASPGPRMLGLLYLAHGKYLLRKLLRFRFFRSARETPEI